MIIVIIVHYDVLFIMYTLSYIVISCFTILTLEELTYAKMIQDIHESFTNFFFSYILDLQHCVTLLLTVVWQ